MLERPRFEARTDLCIRPGHVASTANTLYSWIQFAVAKVWTVGLSVQSPGLLTSDPGRVSP
jgi:hypothetical protein